MDNQRALACFEQILKIKRWNKRVRGYNDAPYHLIKDKQALTLLINKGYVTMHHFKNRDLETEQFVIRITPFGYHRYRAVTQGVAS